MKLYVWHDEISSYEMLALANSEEEARELILADTDFNKSSAKLIGEPFVFDHPVSIVRHDGSEY